MTGPGQTVGPVPDGREPDQYDRDRRRVLWLMPSGLYLLGTRAADERNLMTLNWATQLASDPKLLGVSVERDALSHRLAHEGGVFSLSILRREDRAVVRKFVKPAAASPGELNGFPIRDAPSGAPVLTVAVAWLDCVVRQEVDLGSHTLFVGEITDCGHSPHQDPLEAAKDIDVLRMEDTRMSYGG